MTEFEITGPGYEGYSEKYRLDRNDAEYVECIHTGFDCYGGSIRKKQIYFN